MDDWIKQNPVVVFQEPGSMFAQLNTEKEHMQKARSKLAESSTIPFAAMWNLVII